MRALAVALLIVFAGCLAGPETDGASAGPGAEPNGELMEHLQALAEFPEVRFYLDEGEIRMIFYTAWLPGTTAHVGGLVDDGFYDGTQIHRVVDDFVIQGGDKTGTGEGGSGPLGTSNMIPIEIKDGLQFGSGAVGLARWTDDTGDSQWFITEKPALHLNDPQGATGDVFGAYALFAQVFEGMDVVRQVAAVETLPNDKPVENVFVRNAEMLPPPADADLLGLVATVADGFAADPYIGVLERPRFIVAGHPATFRFTLDGDACQQPLAPQLPTSPAGNATAWQAAAGDGCTFETVVTFDEPGAASLNAAADPAVGGVQFEVLAWHDAYRPFTGASP